ncbi:MAG: D-ribose ABC transporter substrate-binding protein, partial [Anaerolineae bacterium]|nr:D-ribose ABC transporter substrate-binding protein [Anaerolineae bacterium]
MSTKKFVVLLSLLVALGMLLGACQPAATEEAPVADDAPAMEAGGLMCVIVPSVENPFFGSEQVIAMAKAEELGYETLG